MIRLLTHIFAGIIVGLAIHLTVILIMPSQSTNNAWSIISEKIDANEQLAIGVKNLDIRHKLNLDPAFVYAICQVDLSAGPVAYFGDLPNGFWTASLVSKDGSVSYSTTSRTNNDRDFNVAIFNPSQARELAAGEYEVDPLLQIVRVRDSELTAIIRVLPPHRPMAAKFAEQLEQLSCETI